MFNRWELTESHMLATMVWRSFIQTEPGRITRQSSKQEAPTNVYLVLFRLTYK